MTLGELVTAVVLLVTAAIILFYTMYTKSLLQETRRQTELQIRPVIAVGTEGDEFFIKNIGNSTALNIVAGEIMVNVKNDLMDIRGSGRTNQYKYVFDVVNILEPSEKKTLTYRAFLNGEETQAKIPLLASLHPEYQTEQTIELEIDYQNSLMEKYCATITTGKDGIKVKNISKISKG